MLIPKVRCGMESFSATKKPLGFMCTHERKKVSREKFMSEFVSSKKEIIPKWYMCVSPCKFCFNSSAYLCIKIIGVYTIRNELSCAVYGFNSLKFVPLSYKLIYREWMNKRKRKNWQKFCHAVLQFVECVWVSWCLHSINFRTVPASSTTIRNHSKLKRNECEVGKPLVIAAHNAIFHYYLYTYVR